MIKSQLITGEIIYKDHVARCSSKCDYNYHGSYCKLFKKPISDYNKNLSMRKDICEFNFRLQECYDKEIKNMYITDVNDNVIKIEKTPYDKFKFVYDNLKAGKKIKFKYNKNGKTDKGDIIPILYIYTNPQFNVTYAYLQDKSLIIYETSILDFAYNDFEIYEEDKCVVTKDMTLKEIAKKFGYKLVKITEE